MKGVIEKKLSEALNSLGVEGEVGLEHPADLKNGDYATGVALRYAKELKMAPKALAEKIVAAIRDVTKLRGQVELLAPGALPNDGKVIEDIRSYK